MSGFEKSINGVAQWLFFYRMIFILVALVGIVFFGLIAWFDSPVVDRIKNLATVLTCGSIVIGIFYAIVNYEVNYVRYKRDKIAVKKALSFQIASEWHKDSIVNNLKITKKLYDQHEHLIHEDKSKEFSEILEADEAARSALISIFNYFECIAVGINQNILDEAFMNDFFKSMFLLYLNNYDFYIKYRRKKNNQQTSWISFTDLATKWRSE